MNETRIISTFVHFGRISISPLVKILSSQHRPAVKPKTLVEDKPLPNGAVWQEVV